jgi:hypothetical protein
MVTASVKQSQVKEPDRAREPDLISWEQGMDGQTNDQAGMVKELSIPLYQCKGWIKFVGVMSIIGGALYALSLIGIIIAWLPIWMVVLLFQSANAIESAYLSGDRNAMTRALGKLKTYFIIMGVMTLIGIIIMVLAMFFGVLGAIFSSAEF